MHVATIDVMSVNGKITKGQDGHAHDWSSAEDWQHFLKIREQYKVLVMGSRTYEVVRPEPQPGVLRIVLTSRPDEYEAVAVPGQIEFVHAEPKKLIADLERRGYDKMLLVGGQTNTHFFQAKLVDEMYVTVEPLVFGSGRNLLDGVTFDAALRLKSVKQLNERGTLVLHYLVDKR